MMESCLAGKPERVGPVEVDDIRRDLLGEFTALPAQDCVTIEGPDTVVLKAPKTCQSNRQNDKSLPQTAQRFTFTQVFGPGSSQQKVFEGSVRGLVRDVLDGGNCLVFTYGVTNAGKTFTFLGPDHDSGLLPRSLSVIFNSIDGRLYSRCDLKPQRCRDFSRLTPDQQAAESSSKKNLLRLLKEVRHDTKKHLNAARVCANDECVYNAFKNLRPPSKTFKTCDRLQNLRPPSKPATAFKNLQKPAVAFKNLRPPSKPAAAFKNLRPPSKPATAFKTCDRLQKPSKPATAFKNLQKPAVAFKNLRPPSKPATAFKNLRSPSKTCGRLQKPAAAFKNLRSPLKTCGRLQNLRSPLKTCGRLQNLRPPSKTFKTCDRLQKPSKTCGRLQKPAAAFKTCDRLQKPAVAFKNLRSPSKTCGRLQNLRPPSKTCGRLQKPAVAFKNLRPPSKTCEPAAAFKNLRSPSKTCGRLQKPAVAFKNLRSPSKTCGRLQKPAVAFKNLQVAFKNLRSPSNLAVAFKNLRSPSNLAVAFKTCGRLLKTCGRLQNLRSPLKTCRFPVDTTRGRRCVCLRTSKETPSSKPQHLFHQDSPCGRRRSSQSPRHQRVRRRFLHAVEVRARSLVLDVDDDSVFVFRLALCDLAGSERCSRTQNTGERLKEAGNINSSLLTLGKCINAMRLNQHAKPVIIDDAPHRSALELSMIIDEADRRRNVPGRGRKSSMVAWETTLEDVLEDEYGEESDEEEEEEESVMEGTVLEAGGEEDEEQQEEDTTMEQGEEVTMTQQLSVGSNLIGRRPLTLSTLCLCQQSDRQAALRLVLEAQIREEVSAEFMELFNKMEKDYSERLEKEREILEERAEKRVEILKNLVSKTADLPTEEQAALLEGIIGSLTEDLQKIREDAQSVHHCLAEHSQESSEQQQQKLTELMEICQQKDDVIDKLQAAVEDAVESATRDKTLVESIRSELLHLQQTCRCVRRTGGEEVEESRKRQREAPQEEEKDREPARKRFVLEEEIWRLQGENDKKEEAIVELREREQRRRRGLEEELGRREEEVEELKKQKVLLEQEVEKLTALDECSNCDSLFLSLESEQRETSRLSKENKALVNGIFQLQTEVAALQAQLKQQTDRCDSLSEQLHAAEARLHDLGSQSEEKANTISSLTQEVERLRQEVQVEEGRSSSVFHAAMEELKKESVAALQRSADRCEQVDDLQRENRRLQEALTLSQGRCVELSEQLANQKAEFTRQLQSLRVELGSEGGALRGRLQEVERSEKERRRHLERENEAKTIIGLVSGHSVDTVTTATKTRRGRKKLYHTDTSSQLLDSLHTTSEAAEQETESAHLIIKRQLRSKACRK
ncbi:Kinesin-like protein KIF20B [Collichthys lucidus]|uniref:Kinesin-like protein KIF20B n=1 Tax=Collichthys lucidus TaxID=240159 RepID=A0A4U5VN40_COLLU|nr:Kinesin-like protein KIF20B [Collichthys lucidus]